MSERLAAYKIILNIMRVFFFLLLLVLIIIACRNSTSDSKAVQADTILPAEKNLKTPFSKDTQLVLYNAAITLPEGWRTIKDDNLYKIGDATARFRFLNKSGKIIRLDYGLSTSGNPAEPDVQPAIFRKGYLHNKADTAGIIFTDNPRLSEIRAKRNYLFSSGRLSGFSATFFRPKLTGSGYTGIYIDSIGEVADNIADLVFYADGLDSLENLEFEKVSRSLKIKDFR